MANDVKISQLPDAGTLLGTEEVAVNDGGVTRKTTTAAIAGLSTAIVAADTVTIPSASWIGLGANIGRIIFVNAVTDVVQVSDALFQVADASGGLVQIDSYTESITPSNGVLTISGAMGVTGTFKAVLPTTDPHVAGDWWQDGVTVKVSAG